MPTKMATTTKATTVQKRQSPGQYLCGLASWHPAWMQRYATTKMFMAVYGLLGTIQAMSYMYFVVTLTTIERRFKIQSQTTGIMLSGNEISQILLSLILSYIGGQRNRPRWIAWGIVFCGLSCYILATPHFIYGAGEDALQYTQEYLIERNMEYNNATFLLANSTAPTLTTAEKLCGSIILTKECETLLTIAPLVLIFLSQFVLGIGNTLYYSLGQTYLDDNTKKTNTPLMLAIAMSLRMVGPIIGFVIGYISLNMYIDPTKTPLIDNTDPRWLGAWWFGWMILGTLMILFSGLIGLFPKQLPKKNASQYDSHAPQVLRVERELEIDEGEGLPLRDNFSSNAALDHMAPPVDTSDFPKLKDFPKALMRLLRNKLLMYNNISGVFYLLGASGFMTFFTKYMEVQFARTAQNGTIVVGPASILGMVVGLISSGIVITKYKPCPSKVLMWNVIVGGIYMLGQFSYLFLYCDGSNSITMSNKGSLDLTKQCNSNCSCEDVPYSPICHWPSETTYFSPCHAGCSSWDADKKIYSNCSCLGMDIASSTSHAAGFLQEIKEFSGVKKVLPNLLKQTNALEDSLPLSMPSSTHYFKDNIDAVPTTSHSLFDDIPTSDELLSRSRRSMEEITDGLTPGICMKGCNTAFWTYSLAAMIVNWFGSSGRIGNILVNYRAVQPQDKSFAQGLSLMMVSLFALIPGPIIFGRIIDSTCLVWKNTCSGKGNCLFYNQTSFRYYVNILALSFTVIGVAFDALVWYNGRNLDLYGDKEAQRLDGMHHKNKSITPLLTKKPINK